VTVHNLKFFNTICHEETSPTAKAAKEKAALGWLLIQTRCRCSRAAATLEPEQMRRRLMRQLYPVESSEVSEYANVVCLALSAALCVPETLSELMT
jgi:hypothetical protein